MSFPAYPEYKDSEVTWIGDVPTSWEVKPFKWLLSHNDGGVWGGDPSGESDTLVLRSTDQTVDGNWRLIDPAPRKLSAKEKASALLVQGDLVVTKSSGSSLHIGKTTLVTAGIAQQGCCYGNFMQRLRVNSRFTPKLAWYVMNNELARAQLDLLSNSTTGLANLNGTLIGEILLPVPTVAEQIQIARFLDHETARIDALIEEQQRLIELLKEKRQAVISHAVTKGLDPRVPMKDSGVEWLGEVPAHWKQIRIKHILNAMIDAEHKTAEYSDDGEYLVCRTTNVRNGLLSLDGAKYADRNTYIDWTRRGVPEPLDILFTREAPAGEACLVPGNLEICLGQRMVLFKLDKTRIDPAFTVHSIYAGLASDFVKQLSQGSTVSHFNMADIGNIPLFEPPLSEQKGISDFLAKRCDSYDLLINEAQSSVKLISERRSALISAAVTGKIDVRGWQPPTRASSPELEEEAV